MENPTVIPTIKTSVTGSNARKVENVEWELRKVYMKYKWDGFMSMVFFTSLIAFMVAVPIICKEAGNRGGRILVGVLPLPLAVISFLEFVVNAYFVYLIDSGRGDVVGEWRKNKRVVFLLILHCDAYRALKGIERERDKKKMFDGQTNATPPLNLIISTPTNTPPPVPLMI